MREGGNERETREGGAWKEREEGGSYGQPRPRDEGVIWRVVGAGGRTGGLAVRVSWETGGMV